MTTVAPRAFTSAPYEPVYDESSWPIFTAILPENPLSDAAYLAHLDRCTAAYRRGTPFSMLIDVNRHPTLSANQRKLTAERIKRDTERYPNLMVAVAVVTRSALARGFVMAINWMYPPPYPVNTFATRAEATAWLIKSLGTRS